MFTSVENIVILITSLTITTPFHGAFQTLIVTPTTIGNMVYR